MSLSTCRPRKHRQYTAADLQLGIRLVEEERKTIYAASKACGVPWSTLRDYLRRDNKSLKKFGRPFALSSDLEIKLYNYIITMQELGFGLTVNQVQKIAFDLASSVNRQDFLNPQSGSASKWWWDHYKKRYNLTLRVAENLSAYRASMANEEMLQDFYNKLDILLTNLKIKNCPNRLWNCDETGLTYVTNKGRVVTAIGKRFVYNRTYAERGTTTTVLACACADGTWIPPMIIFKGVRWSDNLRRDALPNALVKISPKGWINAELFLEWFKFFISAIPESRPVVLLLDSHASHVTPQVIDLARENEIYLFTFPAHNTHVLQPLDVGVYKPLKSHWADSMKEYMRKNPTQKPERTNFHQILNPAFCKAFTSKNIQNAFKKTGICPFEKNAINREALAPSRLTEKPLQTTETVVASENLLKVPVATEKTTKTSEKRKSTSKSRCLNEEPIAVVPGPSSQAKALPETKKPVPKKQKRISKNKENEPSEGDNDWICAICHVSYSEDAKQMNGKKWFQCSFCVRPFHNLCLNKAPDDDDLYAMCDGCCFNN